MDTDMNVVVPNHNEDVRKAAMGGKHQRSLSLSARWASDKAMAIEYLRRQREVITWIEGVLKRELPTTDLYEALKSGVVLREMMEILFPDVFNCMSPISRNYTKTMAPWKERENISVFLRQCKSIGMYDLSLFCTDDLYEGTNMVQVLFCVQHFMMFSEEQVGHLFKPVAKNEPAEFSNQELEMAMSKIEQAGVDARALKGLMSGSSSSTVPEKTVVHEKESTARASEPASVPSKEEELQSVKEEEPVESDGRTEEKINVEVQSEVCNQVSEDKQDVDNPADDDVNPAQDSGSDAGDDEEAAREDTSVLEQESVVTEVIPVDSPSTQDEETVAIIQLVLSDMAAAIVAEAAAQLATTQTQEIPTVEAESEALNVEVISTPEEKEEVEEEVIVESPEDMVTEVKADTVDEANVEIELTEKTETPAEDSADVPAETTPVEEAASAQPSADTTEIAAEQKENARPHQTEDEELEAKAMAKCMCGRCTIM